MAKRNIDIFVRAKDQASKTLNKIRGSISALPGPIQAAGAAWLGYRGITASFDLAEKGAEAEKMEFAFNRMTQSIGANSTEVLNDIKRMTGGTISDFDAMQKASKAATLGIPIDKVGEFAEIARASAAAMGESTSFMFDSIVTGTARQSKLILDNLGIIVNMEQVYKDETIRLGHALSETEKRQAFLNNVLESGQKIVKDIGDTSELGSEKFERFKASMDDLGRAIGKLLSGPIGGIITGLAFMADNLVDALEPQMSLTEAIRAGVTVWDDYNTEIDDTIDPLESIIKLWKDEKSAVDEAAKTQDEFGNINLDVQGGLDAFGESLGRVAIDATNTAQSIQNTALAQGNLNEETSESIALTDEEIAKINAKSVAVFEAAAAEASNRAEIQQNLEDVENERVQAAIDRLIEENEAKTELNDEFLQSQLDDLDVELMTEEEYALLRINVRAEELLKNKEMSVQEVAVWKKARLEQVNTAKKTGEMIGSVMETGVNTLVDQMMQGQLDIGEVFSNMAGDFTRLFITEILKQAKLALVAKLIKLLTLFDVYENDQMAIRIGEDYMKFFQMGALNELNTGRLAGQMALATAPGFGATGRPGGGVIPGRQGNAAIEIKIDTFIGTKEFVDKEIIPAFEKAIEFGETSIGVD